MHSCTQCAQEEIAYAQRASLVFASFFDPEVLESPYQPLIIGGIFFSFVHAIDVLVDRPHGEKTPPSQVIAFDAKGNKHEIDIGAIKGIELGCKL